SPSYGILIDGDGNNIQLSAEGNILLQSIGATTDLYVAGRVVRTGTGVGSITLQSHRNVILSSGTAVLGAESGTVGATDVTLNADRDGANGGNIQITSASIVTNGGNIVMGGGDDPWNKEAVGSGGSNG